MESEIGGELNRTNREGSDLYCWSFDKAEFDEGRWQLSVEGAVVELERRPLEVLQYLLRHAGEAVTKEELLSIVWADRIVVEAVLTNAIGKLRRALRDDGPSIILTLPRIGYRLDGTVKRHAVEHIPEASRLQTGDSVPRRGNWILQDALARRGDGEVWLARHAKTHEARVFKFSLDGQRLTSLKREVTVGRLLEQALGSRPDFVHAIDWDFEQAPYFIEFELGGTSLDHWPAIADMSFDDRLALFAEAATAVSVAHGVGVLHKDLKPANLLVYGEPGDLHLRVADFGSSRVFDQGLLVNLGITGLGLTQTQMLPSDSGTPLYLAPEVLAGQAPTIKSDIYALGVTLYQLLVGDFQRPLAAGWENDIADPLLREDIAAAANGDPAKRPNAAIELAESIRTLGQRRQKAALEAAIRARITEGEKRLERMRTRRPWVIAAGALLVFGAIFTGLLWQRSERQGELAQQQAKRADTVLQYLSYGLIRSVAVGGKGYEKDPTIKEMVEYASATVNDNFRNDAATRGSLQAAIGASWSALANVRRSVDHYRAAWKDYVQAFGQSNELTLMTQYELARQLALAGDFDEALKRLDAADKLAGTRLQQGGKLALWAAWSRGTYYNWNNDQEKAELFLRRAESLLPQAEPNEQAMASRISLVLADVYQRQGKSQKVIDLIRAKLADPSVSSESLRNGYRNTMAEALSQQRKFAEALVFAKAAATSSEKLLGADAHATLVAYQTVARMQLKTEGCPKALETQRRTWALEVRRYGMINRNTLLDGDYLASSEIKCGNKPAGQVLKDQIFAAMEKNFPDDGFTQGVRYYRARALIEKKRYQDALTLLNRIDVVKLASVGSSPSAKFHVEALRGECFLGLGDKVQAHALIADALDEFTKLDVNPNAPTIVLYRKLLKESGG